jgi:hypothetical protein
MSVSLQIKWLVGCGVVANQQLRDSRLYNYRSNNYGPLRFETEFIIYLHCRLQVSPGCTDVPQSPNDQSTTQAPLSLLPVTGASAAAA